MEMKRTKELDEYYQYYFRRGNKCFFINKHGKITTQSKELKDALRGVKYGTKMILSFD